MEIIPFVIWPLFFIQMYFSYYYYHTLMIERHVLIDQEKKKILLRYLILQFILFLVVAASVFVWTRMVFSMTPYHESYLAFMIILLISHARFIFSYFLIRFKPIGYLYNHSSFLIIMALFITFYFIKIPTQIRKYYPICAGLAVLCMYPKIPPIFSVMFMVFFGIGYYQDETMMALRYHKWWPLVIGISLMAGIGQTIIHRHVRDIIYPNKSEDKMELSGIHKMNILEEYYLINHRVDKLSKRPISTATYLEFFRLNPEQEKLGVTELEKAYQKLYPSKIKMDVFDGDVGVLIQHDDGKKADIIFRGTNNAMEWIGNLAGGTHVYSKRDKGYKHAQIGGRIKNIFEKNLKENISKLKELQKINIYGHSRGSTMAVYCALQIADTLKEMEIELFLYAPPPLLDPNLSIKDKKIIAHTIIDKKDILYALHRSLPIGTSIFGQKTQIDLEKDGKKKESFLVKKKKGKGYNIQEKQSKTPMIFHDLYLYLNQ